MSGLLNSALNGSTSNLPDTPGRSFSTAFPAQSAASAPVYPHSGSMQGLHTIHGSFNVPNVPGTLATRNSAINSVPASGVQQLSGNLSGGRFASNNLPVSLSQLSHGSSHGHSTATSRGGIIVGVNPSFTGSMNGVGGSISGISPSSAAVNSRSTIPGLVSPMLGNGGSRITVGNNVGGGNMGRSIGSGGGLSVGLASRLNLTSDNGSGTLGMQGSNRLSGVLQPGTQQVMSMLGNSYPSVGGPLSQGLLQARNSLSSMGYLNDMNSNDNSPFDINDFPQLNGRPSSAGGPQGQLGSLRKQSAIVQPNEEFSIQNEDFPALPGFKGGNADYAMDMHQKDQFHNNAASMIQSQQFPMGRSSGFSLGGIYSSHRPLQQQHVTSGGVSFTAANNQDLLQLNGSDLFPPSLANYHSQVQTTASANIGLRPLNSSSSLSGMGSYDLIQQYQQQQNQSLFRLQQMSAISQSYGEQNTKPMQVAQGFPDRFGLLGLLSVIKMSDPGLTSLALGIDLTTLGLNLNSTENLYKTFGSPWSDEPAIGEPEYRVPECYSAKEPYPLHQGYFSKFQLETLFYIFYSMPKDEAQLYAANELYNRGWLYHKQLGLWLMRVPKTEPLVKTDMYERGSYICFDINSWQKVLKEHFLVKYEMLEKRPLLPQH